MADEELDLDLEGQEQINKTEKRIKDLSEKVRLTSNERDDLAKAKQEAEASKDAALKEVEFFKGFSAQTSKYPTATEYQDKIKEKVMAGYDVEDATISILAREGKLTMPSTPPAPRESPAGGSAANTITATGDKTVPEMTQEERRAELQKNEGDLQRIFS